LGQVWSNICGKRMTQRLMRWMVPGLVWNQQIYGETLRACMNSQTRWLDIGCGWRLLGKGLERLEDDLVTSPRLVVGCDLELSSLAKHRNIRKVLMTSAESLPFADGSFDLVSCNMVAEHFSDPPRCLAEMARVLAPGGHLVIHTPNLWNYAIFLNHTVGRVLPRKLVLTAIKRSENRDHSDVFLTYYRANTVKRLTRLCADLGLKQETARVLTSPQPFFNFFVPLALPQIPLMWLTKSSPYFRRFGQTLLMGFRREG